MSDERIVVAAVDNSLAANPVLVGARALARMLDARVEAIHVITDGEVPPTAAASAVGVPLRTTSGPVVDRLIDEAGRPGVVGIVIGARASPRSQNALGSTAMAVVTSCERPIMVVPPVGRIAPIFRKVLVPLEGTVSTSLAPKSIVELGRRSSIDVVAFHVHEEGEGMDNEEFLRSFCPWGIGFVNVEQRTGRSQEMIPAVADELACDVVALGWAQALGPGRAEAVRGTLERATVPVILIPVRVKTPRLVTA